MSSSFRPSNLVFILTSNLCAVLETELEWKVVGTSDMYTGATQPDNTRSLRTSNCVLLISIKVSDLANLKDLTDSVLRQDAVSQVY